MQRWLHIIYNMIIQYIYIYYITICMYIYMLWYVIYILYSKLRRGNAVGFRSLCIVYVYHILYILYRIQQGLIKLMGNKGEQTRFTWTWSLNCFIDRNTAEDSAQDLSDTRHLYKFPQLEWHLPSSWPRGPTLQHLDHSYRKSAVSCRASKNTFFIMSEPYCSC